MPGQAPKILVVSHNPDLADVRKQVLEAAGYHVLPVAEASAVSKRCKRQKIALVLIGYSVPPSEKRQVWNEARKVCKNAPILELHSATGPSIMEPTALYHHESKTPQDFLGTVKSLVPVN